MTLEEIKDQLANEHYSTPYWIWLNDYQRSNLVDHVALKYAIEQVSEFAIDIKETFTK